jgi:predicted nucleotidyltransferase
MIKGLNRTQATIRELDSIPGYDFHLTGSRFFGTHGPNSDWDFFVEAKDEDEKKILEAHLEGIGFRLREDATNPLNFSKNDCIFGNAHYPMAALIECEILGIWELNMVHVQVVENTWKKLRIQKLLKEIIPYEESKSQRSKIWRAMYAATSIPFEMEREIDEFLEKQKRGF